MKKMITFFASCLILTGAHSSSHLDDKYLVSFGNPDSEIKIVEYVSFSCHHCIDLFQKHFAKIKRDYLDTGLVHWTFHPVPLDFVTVQALHCLEQLDQTEKKIFFEAVFEELEVGEPEQSSLLLQTAVKILGKPLPDLSKKEYLTSTNAFEEAFYFVKNNEDLNVVPAISFNGQVIPYLVPDEELLEQLNLIFMEKPCTN